MPFRLRSRLHWCLCADRVVFLDLEADRYFLLPPEAGQAFRRLADRQLQAGDEERLRALIGRDLLIPCAGPARVAPGARLSEPIGDFAVDPQSAILPDIARAVAAQAYWASALRLRPLHRLVASFEARAGTCTASLPDKHERTGRIVAGFASAAVLVRAADRCLVRALALQSTCLRHGIRPRLVFGVRLNPFRAHCWVQLDRRVLIGDFEQARLFTPIAVLG